MQVGQFNKRSFKVLRRWRRAASLGGWLFAEVRLPLTDDMCSRQQQGTGVGIGWQVPGLSVECGKTIRCVMPKAVQGSQRATTARTSNAETPGGGGGDSSVLDANYPPPTNRWPKPPPGGGGGWEGGFWKGRWGGALRGGVREGRWGGGGPTEAIWGGGGGAPITSPCPPSNHSITINQTPTFAAS